MTSATAEQSSVLFSHARCLLREFETLEPNWDSYGAESVTPAAVQTAETLLARLGTPAYSHLGSRREPYHTAPLAEGGIQFEWRGPSADVEVEIHADGSLAYLIDDRGAPESRFQVVRDASLDQTLRAIVQIID